MISVSKIRLILGCCLLLVLFTSCRPREVLSRNEMTDVLFDIHMTEAAVSGTYEPIPEQWTRGLSTEYFRDMAYRAVLRKHHLTQEKFYLSVSWYSNHMNLYEKVYMDVQQKMEDFKTAVDQGSFDPIRSMTLYGADTAKIRALYDFGQYRSDTVPVIRLYLPADSMPSSSHWLSNQLIFKVYKDTTRLRLYPASPIQLSEPDSLRKRADSLLLQKTIPETPTIRKEVLAPGARRLPTRNFREVPKSEQIRKRFQQRAVEQEQQRREEAQRQKRIDAARK